MLKKISYGKHFIDNKDIVSVVKALKAESITNGKNVLDFENKLKKYFRSKYVSVCNSGTSAIFLAFNAISLKKNDTVIMPVINFVASYNMAKSLGAKIFLADVDSNTGQMTAEKVLECCEKYKLKKVKAIVPMYMGGYPEDAYKFLYFKKKYNCYIIEDSCHAFGASYFYKNKYYKVGSCKHSDISTFSLHPLKTITTGEGGILSTNNKKLHERVKQFRSHGLIKNKIKHWIYKSKVHGFNFRLNDFQCALGLSQLTKVNRFINYRKKIFNFYKKNIKNFNLIEFPKYYHFNKPSYHLFIVNLKKCSYIKKEKFMKYMVKKKIIVQYHYTPIYKFDTFRDKFIGKEAEKFYNSSISLPIYYGLKEKNLNYIVNTINSYFKS